jgi:hypothetical protein
VPVVVIFVFYGSCEFVIPLLFAGAVELAKPALPYFGALIAGGITLLGLVCYATSFSDAVKQRNALWVLDHFLAPLAASVFVLVYFEQILSFAGDILRFDASMAHSVDFIGPLGSLALGIGGIIVILGAPVLALAAMASDFWPIRLGSYLGFLVTGSYYGVILLATLTHHALPSVTM